MMMMMVTVPLGTRQVLGNPHLEAPRMENCVLLKETGLVRVWAAQGPSQAKGTPGTLYLWLLFISMASWNFYFPGGTQDLTPCHKGLQDQATPDSIRVSVGGTRRVFLGPLGKEQGRQRTVRMSHRGESRSLSGWVTSDG